MKFKNVSGDDRVLAFGLVPAGESTPDLTAEQAKGLEAQDIWEPVGKSKPAGEKGSEIPAADLPDGTTVIPTTEQEK